MNLHFWKRYNQHCPTFVKFRIKVAVNASASDTQRLHDILTTVVQNADLQLSVVWISGDEVLLQLLELHRKGSPLFENLCTEETLDKWTFEPVAD
jgi:hypothetical protein